LIGHQAFQEIGSSAQLNDGFSDDKDGQVRERGVGLGVQGRPLNVEGEAFKKLKPKLSRLYFHSSDSAR
jgi:hypothetical protein